MPIPQFLPGETLSASTLQQLGIDATYTPTLTAITTDPSLGTSPSQVGLIWINGQKVDVWYQVGFGSGGTSGSGNYEIALPTEYRFASNNVDFAVGVGRILNNNTSDETMTIAVANVINNTIQLRSTENSAPVTHAAPYTMGSGIVMNGHISYLTDFGGA